MQLTIRFLVNLRSQKHIYIYIYIYIHGAFNKFPDFFCTGIQNCRRLLKNSVCYCYISYEMTDQFL